MKWISCLILPLIVVFVSCSDDHVTEPEDTRPLMPLEVGHSWTYSVFTETDVAPVDSTITIGSKISIRGTEYFKEAGSDYLYRETGEGLQMGILENGEFKLEYNFYHPNAKEFKHLDLAGHLIPEASKGHSRVDAGFFETYSYTFVIGEGERIQFEFSLGTGLIKKSFITDLPGDKGFDVDQWQLKNYEVE